MKQDPEMTWEGDYPYDVVTPAGFTPQSSMDDIIKAKSYFAKKHRMGQAHVALSLLEEVRERLLLDFFLYCSDTETLLEETHGE